MKTIPLLAFSLLLVTPAFGQDVRSTVGKLDEKRAAKTESLNAEYLVFRPELKGDAKAPLLICLHGAGAEGHDLNRVRGLARTLVRGIAKFEKGPCIVVAPQCDRRVDEDGGGWLPADLNLLLEHLRATLPIDEKRIYLTGVSMGGYGSWVWGGNHPEHFAAVAPVVGGLGPGGPKDVTPDLDAWAANLAKIPVYAFAGAQDRVVPAERSERMIAAIRKAGGKQAKLKIYPDEAHGAGRVVFSNAEFYDWMFSQKRK